MNCKKCEFEIADNYCSNCGQPAKLKRIDKHYLSHEIQHLLHFEKGVFYTVKELMVSPGKSIREFLKSDRTKHMKPVAFLILTSLLFTLVAHFFHADDIYNEKEKIMLGKSSVGKIMHWIQAHYGYGNIISGFFYAICVMLFFRKYKYNLFEITVLLCFVMGQAMLLLIIPTVFIGVTGAQFYKVMLFTITFAYPTWAIGQFFDGSKIVSYVKAFAAYLLGYILFYLTIILVGVMADWFIR